MIDGFSLVFIVSMSVYLGIIKVIFILRERILQIYKKNLFFAEWDSFYVLSVKLKMCSSDIFACVLMNAVNF